MLVNTRQSLRHWWRTIRSWNRRPTEAKERGSTASKASSSEDDERSLRTWMPMPRWRERMATIGCRATTNSAKRNSPKPQVAAAADRNVRDMNSKSIPKTNITSREKCPWMAMTKKRFVRLALPQSFISLSSLQDQTSENNDEMDEEDLTRLRTCITAMQETLATNDDPDISLISDYFKETFDIRRNFVKTHNTTEILAEYPALQLHSCVSRSPFSERERERDVCSSEFSYWPISTCKRTFPFRRCWSINFEVSPNRFFAWPKRRAVHRRFSIPIRRFSLNVLSSNKVSAFTLVCPHLTFFFVF